MKPSSFGLFPRVLRGCFRGGYNTAKVVHVSKSASQDRLVYNTAGISENREGNNTLDGYNLGNKVYVGDFKLSYLLILSCVNQGLVIKV